MSFQLVRGTIGEYIIETKKSLIHSQWTCSPSSCCYHQNRIWSVIYFPETQQSMKKIFKIKIITIIIITATGWSYRWPSIRSIVIIEGVFDTSRVDKVNIVISEERDKEVCIHMYWCCMTTPSFSFTSTIKLHCESISTRTHKLLQQLAMTIRQSNIDEQYTTQYYWWGYNVAIHNIEKSQRKKNDWHEWYTTLKRASRKKMIDMSKQWK